MKPEYPSDKQDKFMLRLPDGMRDQIAAAAKENGRSMNAEISYRLSLSVPSSVTIRTQLRMPADLHNRIQDACKESGRSMNAETVYRLQESFDACIADRPSGSSTLESSIDPKPTPRQARRRVELTK